VTAAGSGAFLVTARLVTLLLLLAAVQAIWDVPSARAQPSFAGNLSGQAIRAESRWGGGVMADLTLPLGEFRLGGALGAAVVRAEDDARSRVLMPLALSLGVLLRPEPVWIMAEARAGAWTGATNDGLRVGGFLSGGAYLGYALGPRIALSVGAEAWFLAGHGDVVAFVPGIRFSWVPPES